MSSKRGVEAAAMDDAIEHEMKRLRLAYDYSDANEKWTPPAVDDGDTEMEDAADDCHAAGSQEYQAANALLREMHFLRQLRKFQAARRAAERHAQQPQPPPAPYPHAHRL